MVCESHSSLKYRKHIILLALEIGFRHISPQSVWMEAELTHMESYQEMIDIVFQSGESEAIADLLCAWTSSSNYHGPHLSLGMCAEYLVGLSHLQPFSPRLRQVVIWSIELIGYQAFEQVGVEGFAGLLNGLHVCIDDMSNLQRWGGLLLDTIQSPEGIQNVQHQCWELVVEAVVMDPWILRGMTRSPHIMTSLMDAKEWDKLECWMGIIWMVWSTGGEMDEEFETDEKLEHVTLSLFQNQLGAVQKLDRWVGRVLWPTRERSRSFQQAFDEVHLNAEQQGAL